MSPGLGLVQVIVAPGRAHLPSLFCLCLLGRPRGLVFFFFNDPSPPELSPLPLPAPLPIRPRPPRPASSPRTSSTCACLHPTTPTSWPARSCGGFGRPSFPPPPGQGLDYERGHRHIVEAV